MTKQWENRLDNGLQDRLYFWICPRCGFRLPKKSHKYKKFKEHLKECAVDCMQEELRLLHPEVSDPDEEC